MKRKVLKLITICSAIVVTGLQTLEAQSISNTDLDISNKAYSDVDVTATVDSTFTVKLPAHIELTKNINSGKGICNSLVGVKGDLQKGKSVLVLPDDSFALFDITNRPDRNSEVPRSEAEQSGYTHKSPETVNVTQGEILWREEELKKIVKEEGSKYNYDPITGFHNVALNLETARSMSAGEWSGFLTFEIQYDTYYPTTSIYANVDSMLDADCPTGSFIRTRGYNAPKDGGGSVYEVVDTAVANNITAFQLNNGKYAELVYDKDSVLNVAAVGIFPGENIGERFCTLLGYVGNGAKGIKFNDGEYFLDKQVCLKSLSYYGTNNTVIKIANNFANSANRIFLTSVDGDELFNVNLYNLKFEVEVSEDFSLKNNRIILMSLRNINSCTIDRCSFVAKQAAENGVFTVVDLLWFQHSDKLRNIVIKNTNFNNLMGEGYVGSNTDYIQGGCLWFNGNSKETSKLNNVHISDCLFNNTISDETLALWNCSMDEFIIEGCTFNNHSHNSNNIFNLYDGSISNSQMRDCVFNMQTPAQFVCKVMRMSTLSEFKYSGCTFNFLYTGEMEQSEAQGIFYLLDNVDNAISTNVVIDDCTFTTEGDKCYEALVCGNKIKSKDIILSNCQIDILLKNSILSLMNSSNVAFRCQNNNIDTDSTHFMYLGAVQRVGLDIEGNSIANTVDTRMNQYATVDYTFKNNYCLKDGDINLLFANWLDSSYGKSTLRVEGNTFKDTANIQYFVNNNPSIDDNDLISLIIGDNNIIPSVH